MVGARAKCGSPEVRVELVLEGVVGVEVGGTPPSGLKNQEATDAHWNRKRNEF